MILDGGGTPRCSGGCAGGPACLLMLLAAYVGTGPARLMSKTCIGKKKIKKQRFLSAGSISVLADAFKLGREIIYNYQQSPDAR